MSARDRLFRGWAALRDACRAQHPRGPGGAMLCVCGAPCGGSEACAMLATVRDLIQYLPTDGLPAEWRERVEALRGVLH